MELGLNSSQFLSHSLFLFLSLPLSRWGNLVGTGGRPTALSRPQGAGQAGPGKGGDQQAAALQAKIA